MLWFRGLLVRAVTPRVVCVTLTGIIAADGDVRLGAQYSYGGRPELLSPDVTFVDGAERQPRIDGEADRDPRTAGLRSDAVINLQRVDRLLTKAFASRGARAVCLIINSPGGSPAQSSLIYQRLRALRKRHKNMPLLAFVEDAAVSGGYYIACAADEVIADPSSIVGSIGVISRGFGYVKAIKKQGVSRRVHASGDSKSGIDPYMPMKPRDLKQQRRLLTEIHENFIAAVKEGRGDRLKPEAAATIHASTTGGAGCSGLIFGRPSKRKVARLADDGAGLFDGTVYSGEAGLEVGLVDAVGEMHTTLQKRFGRHVRIETIEDDRVDSALRLLRWLF